MAISRKPNSPTPMPSMDGWRPPLPARPVLSVGSWVAEAAKDLLSEGTSRTAILTALDRRSEIQGVFRASAEEELILTLIRRGLGEVVELPLPLPPSPPTGRDRLRPR